MGRWHDSGYAAGKNFEKERTLWSVPPSAGCTGLTDVVKEMLSAKYTVASIIVIIGLAGAYYIYAPKAEPERERMVEMTIPNFNWVGTPKDAHLRVKVPVWAELVFGYPETLAVLVDAVLGGSATESGAQIPFLRSPHGAELTIGVGTIDDPSGFTGETESTPAGKEPARIGRWEGRVSRDVNRGIAMISFHVVSENDYAIGGVSWREENDEAAREAEVLLDSVLESVQHAKPANTGSSR